MHIEGNYILETEGKIIDAWKIGKKDPRLLAKDGQDRNKHQVKIWWNSTRMALCFKNRYLLKAQEGKLLLDDYNGERPEDNDESCWFEMKNVGGDTHYNISAVHQSGYYLCITGSEVHLAREQTRRVLVTHVPVQEAA